MTKFIIGDIGDIAPFPVTVNSGAVSGSLIIDNDEADGTPATNALEVTGSVYIGGNLTVVGTTTTIDVTQLLIDDKLLTLNDGGVSMSGDGAGLEVEENGVISGFIKTDASGNWTFKQTKADPTTSPLLTLDVDATSTLTIEASSVLNQDLTTDASVTFDTVNATFVGDGSGLTGAGSVSAVANGVNNRLVTFSSTDALSGEANLTFDGSVLNIAGGIQHKRHQFTATGGAASYTPVITDYVIGVNTSAIAATINLPAASLFEDGQLLVIKDEGGTASSNSITIARNGSDSIDASTSVILSSNYAAISIYSNGVDKWHIY